MAFGLCTLNGVTAFVLCSILKLLSMQETIQRYQRHTKDVQTDNSLVEENMQHLKHEAADMAKQIELLEVAKRKLLGEDLGSCTMEELQQIEQQLERSVSRVRAKKMEAFMEQIDQLKEKEKVLTAENAKLCEKVILSFPLFGLYFYCYLYYYFLKYFLRFFFFNAKYDLYYFVITQILIVCCLYFTCNAMLFNYTICLFLYRNISSRIIM
ncbi:MADS-box protein SOC1-like [Camellia sinensis]|uniref:MADS-box protein SOC1-like n=1 Tax=Camellia sinensis TaxID=4442 RepID=UPI001036D74F|nr:MADS-box protein SOC1-like [Camellia sinensis]